MEIIRTSLLAGAEQAEGLVVVIDVLRAFSTACYIASTRPEHIILVDKPEDAYRLKKKKPETVLVGERNWRNIEGFDHNNSPLEVKDLDLSGRTVVQTTSAGTRGVLAAMGADQVITGSFVNAGAVVEHIRRSGAGRVTLVAMGVGGSTPAPEDELCARYIKATVQGELINFGRIVEHIASTPSGKRFLGEEIRELHREDLHLCMSKDRFDFILRARPLEGGMVELERIDLTAL